MLFIIVGKKDYHSQREGGKRQEPFYVVYYVWDLYCASIRSAVYFVLVMLLSPIFKSSASIVSNWRFLSPSIASPPILPSTDALWM